MTFLAPAFFAAAVAVALGTVIMHFIVTRQPASEPLPTARFVPAARVQVTTLARRPEDLLLLLLRVVLVLLVGAAFARPVVTPPRRPLARVILLDRSAAVADLAAGADSARRLAGDGDVVLGFDATVPLDEAAESIPRRTAPVTPDGAVTAASAGSSSQSGTASAERDSAAAAGLSQPAAPSLSAALVAGIRAGTRLRDAADSIELVIVSPFPREAW
ncbi:MAG TPA: BatA domain-containing protein, partial [Gemmatimonadales bacterium]|nr:BatA domain-containing protein [Gemmatimonadales bacterium]